jgi:integrase
MAVGRETDRLKAIPTMPLSDLAIRTAKPAPRIIKMSDGGGLQLWIMPTGSKLWRIAYRHSGKQKLLAIGGYPALSLAAARERRDRARELMALGIDPMDQKRRDEQASAEARANTFSKLAAELLEKKRREGKASNTIGKREWLYGFAANGLGGRPIREITARDVLDVLKSVEAKGLIDTAHRLRASIGEVFRYAIATQRANNDPTYALRGALQSLKPKHRAAITDAKGTGALLRAIADFEGQPTTIAALQMMAYLFPRPGELRLAEWKEFDLEAAVWTIPASRTKMRREHRVPLPRQTITILTRLFEITGFGVLVFPGLRTPKRSISENTMNAALRRMGYGNDDMTAHGFRATASTLLNESGKFAVDIIERALAHQDPDSIRRVYARGEYWPERVAMMEWWADQLDAWRDGAKLLAFDRPA